MPINKDMKIEIQEQVTVPVNDQMIAACTSPTKRQA
jgi:hypothetical protein